MEPEDTQQEQITWRILQKWKIFLFFFFVLSSNYFYLPSLFFLSLYTILSFSFTLKSLFSSHKNKQNLTRQSYEPLKVVPCKNIFSVTIFNIWQMFCSFVTCLNWSRHSALQRLLLPPLILSMMGVLLEERQFSQTDSLFMLQKRRKHESLQIFWTTSCCMTSCLLCRGTKDSVPNLIQSAHCI